MQDQMAPEPAENLRLDISLVDEDHEILFNLFTELENATSTNQELKTIGSFLNMIIEYSAHHFAREEALMKACSISNLKLHAEEHRKIIEGLLKLKRRYFSDNAVPLQPEEMKLCRAWLVDHIKAWDKTYADTMHEMPQEVIKAGEAFAQKKKNNNGFI